VKLLSASLADVGPIYPVLRTAQRSQQVLQYQHDMAYTGRRRRVGTSRAMGYMTQIGRAR
jgi:hypothetical protein